jgi:quercetin 2,3-dioxygenase
MRDTASLTVIAEQERDMDRRNFIGSIAPAVIGPCLLGAAGSAAGQSADTAMAAFSLAEGETRFGEETILFGSSANDIKVSGHDSQSRLAVFEYQGTVRGGPPLHVHPDQDEIFFVQNGRYVF